MEDYNRKVIHESNNYERDPDHLESNHDIISNYGTIEEYNNDNDDGDDKKEKHENVSNIDRDATNDANVITTAASTDGLEDERQLEAIKGATLAHDHEFGNDPNTKDVKNDCCYSNVWPLIDYTLIKSKDDEENVVDDDDVDRKEEEERNCNNEDQVYDSGGIIDKWQIAKLKTSEWLDRHHHHLRRHRRQQPQPQHLFVENNHTENQLVSNIERDEQSQSYHHTLEHNGKQLEQINVLNSYQISEVTDSNVEQQQQQLEQKCCDHHKTETVIECRREDNKKSPKGREEKEEVYQSTSSPTTSTLVQSSSKSVPHWTSSSPSTTAAAAISKPIQFHGSTSGFGFKRYRSYDRDDHYLNRKNHPQIKTSTPIDEHTPLLSVFDHTHPSSIINHNYQNLDLSTSSISSSSSSLSLFRSDGNIQLNVTNRNQNTKNRSRNLFGSISHPLEMEPNDDLHRPNPLKSVEQQQQQQKNPDRFTSITLRTEEVIYPKNGENIPQTIGGNLSYKPYPKPKSCVQVMTANNSGGGGVGDCNTNPNTNNNNKASNRQLSSSVHHCHHHHHHHNNNHNNHYQNRCYDSSDGDVDTSYDNGNGNHRHNGHYQHQTASHQLNDTWSLDTSTDSKAGHETFKLKFPKLKYFKVALLSGLIIYTLISFISIQEKEEKWTNVAVQEKQPAFVDLSHSLDLMFPVWKLRAQGSFLPAEYARLTNYSVIFTVVQLLNDSQGGDRNGAYRLVKGPWAAPITPAKLSQYMNNEVEHVFKLTRGDAYDHIHRYQLRIDTNSEESVGITVNMAGFSELSADGIILAVSVLVFLYTLIIFEIVNRTLAAILGATAAITCLTLIRDRPSLEKVVSWLDVETLCLLFGMMVLVAILCETGFFDYVAVLAFKMAKGRTWPLIFTLCFFTGILSAFLDNVTTILLMTPVTIRLCEIKNIDPKHVLIAQVMFSNIGGAATPVGDPPNVIIISSAKIQQQGVDFGRFTLHMMPGIILSFLATLAYFRLFYGHLAREYPETNENQFELQHEYDPEMNMAKTGTSTLSDNKPNQVISPNGPRRLSNSLDTSQYRRPSLERSISPRTFTTTSHRSMFVSKSVGGHGGHDEHRSTDYDLSYSGRNRQMVSRTNPEPYFTCNSMEDFCAATPARDSILDERRVFRSSDELKREIEVWKRATNSISGYSRDENSVRNVLNRKVEILETILQDHCYETVPPEDNYHSVLNELEAKYKIRDYPLLYKSGIVMTLVISLFFMQSIPNLDLSLGWIAILGATLLLVLSDRHELDSIIGRVEWSTLIFFAALFVVMEALAELKFLWWIGRLTQDFINSVPEQHRLVVAILLFVWISAIASSFIDNIPLTTVMVKIIEDLSENNEFNIPLTPLIYALAFGACLGGNGTLIGASSNVVCAGVAEQHGYRFTFVDFFKVGFPIMIITIIISSFYLVLCHVVFEWNF